MPSNLDVLFTPAEFAALKSRDLSGTVCVVFDVLRATTSMITALAAGATRIFPVREIADAVQLKRQHPNALLAGERDGLRILAAQSGGIDFDLGNSPREFTASRVAGREIIMTTTNGTRALQACVGAQRILPAAILNLGAVAAWLERKRPARLFIVCSGTYEEAAYEDAWAAGALCELIWPQFQFATASDSVEMAREIYRAAPDDMSEFVKHSRNARRLLAGGELGDDVAFSWRRDAQPILGELRDGSVARLDGSA